jgi:multidrug efflux system membrane fusion protein
MTGMKAGMLVAGVLGILFLWGCGEQGAENGEPPGIPVRTAPVVREAVSVPIHTSGKVVSSVETRLAFKVGGIVGRVPVDEGESVGAGQLLAELRGDEIDAQVAQARSAFDKAQRDLERARRLYGDSVATLEQLQDAQTGFEMAGAQLEIAEFNRVHSAIYAPSEGTILKRFAEVGELVGPGMPVILFGAGGDAWLVRVGVTDRDIMRLDLGDSAGVSVDAYPGREFPARVVEIGESADPLTGTYEVELALGKADARMVSGFVAGVDIYPATCQPMWVIPIEALMEADGERAYVYVPDGESAMVKKIPVTIGCLMDRRVAVTEGLDGISRVVTDGAAYLTDKAAIRVVDDVGGRD